MLGRGSDTLQRPDRRLVVLSVADMRAPGGALALLAGFRQRQMREQAPRQRVPLCRDHPGYFGSKDKPWTVLSLSGNSAVVRVTGHIGKTIRWGCVRQGFEVT